MKVIKKGRPQKGWAKECECTGAGNNKKGCGAILLVEQADLFYTYSSCMGRDETYHVTFQCPECTQFTDLSDTPFYGSRLPSHADYLKGINLNTPEKTNKKCLPPDDIESITIVGR